MTTDSPSTSYDFNADISAEALLQWYVEAGVDECIGDMAIDRFSAADAAAVTVKDLQPALKKVQAEIKNNTAPAAHNYASTPNMRDNNTLQQEAATIAVGCQSLEELEDAIRQFDNCSLKKTASHTVFADGNPASRVMIIGDAPGVDDDRTGKPFAGNSGELLKKMLAAIGLDKQTDAYMTNILPWRPPGNRKPTDQEINLCLPFIRRHIELAAPDILILFGGITITALTGNTASISRLRGKWHDIKLDHKTIPAMASFHPSYLLSQPASKADAWHDLLLIKEKIQNPTVTSVGNAD